MRIRQGLSVAALLLASCARVSGRAESALASNAECFFAATSLVYPLGDRGSASRGLDSTGVWLVLAPAEDHAVRGRSGEARTIDVYGNRQSGFWWPRGDSLSIQVFDVFTLNQLMVARTRTGVAGRGGGTTDVLERDSAGVLRQSGSSWPAELRRIACDSVPSRAR